MKNIAVVVLLMTLIITPAFAFDKKDKKQKESAVEQTEKKEKKERKQKKEKEETPIAEKKQKKEKSVITEPSTSEIVMVKGGPTTKKYKATADLQKTYWRLAEMNGKPVTLGEKEAYIILSDKKSALEGNTGCNSIVGTYQAGRRGELVFQYGTTKMMCNDMAVEAFVNNALSKTNMYDINGQYLMLYNNTELLAIFEAKYAE